MKQRYYQGGITAIIRNIIRISRIFYVCMFQLQLNQASFFEQQAINTNSVIMSSKIGLISLLDQSSRSIQLEDFRIYEV